MKKLRQAGFTAFEAIVALLIVAALVGVGVWVMKRETAEPSASNTSEAIDLQENTEAPAVDNTEDLEAAEKLLDDSNLDAGTNENAELDRELGTF